MAFNDLLSTSFLFSVAIIIILIGGIFAYVSYRMSEQDHKITSMVGLISTMAEELQFFRSKLSQGPIQGQSQEQQQQQGGLQRQSELNQIHTIPILDPNNLVTGATNLISVSDDESESEESGSESDESETESEESGSESEESSSDDDFELDEVVDLEERMQIQESVQTQESMQISTNNIDDFNHSDATNIKSIHLEEPIELNAFSHGLEHDHDHDHEIEDLLASDLKTISITDLEDTNKKTDYKKMSITKLREEVIKNGIVIDASKLKKGELLKLLGDE
jgi:hypothetical protein